MGIMCRSVYGALKEKYEDVSMTTGYITKNARIQLRLEKPHVTDTYCLSGNHSAILTETMRMQRKVCRNNRQIFKETRSEAVSVSGISLHAWLRNSVCLTKCSSAASYVL